MRIEIINWAKYNPRSDIKHTTWFRLENTFWSDPAIFRLDNGGKMVWLLLLSLASQRGSGVIEVDFDFISSVIRIDEAAAMFAIEQLQGSGKIKKATSRPRHVHVTSTSRPRHATYGRTNETNETNTPKPPRKRRGLAGPDFKSRAMGLIGTMLGAPPEAWTDDAQLEALLGPDNWSLFLRRFPRGGEQFVSYWADRQKEGAPQTVMTAQLRDIFVGFMEAPANGGGFTGTELK